MMDADAEILKRISKIEHFLESVLYEDSLEDWKLAKDLGELLIRIDGDEIMGHALVARASRHLGDFKRVVSELDHCRVRVPDPPPQKEMFLSFLAEEDRFLSERPPRKEGEKEDQD